MADKFNTMVIKVDLQCAPCYKKIKKLLCKFPEIRDQIYDEKQNTVTVTVSSCCTERIRDKLYCKGGKTIKSIDIKLPTKPKEPEKKPKESEKLKEPEKKPKEPEKKPKEPEKKPKEPEKKPKEPEKKPKESEKKPKEPETKKEAEKPKVTEKLIPNGKADKPKETEKLKPSEKGDKPTADQKKPPPMAQKSLEPAHGAPIPIYGYPTFYPSGGPCCGPCCNGYGSGQDPCNQAYGTRPVPVYDNYGYGQYGQNHFGDSRGHYVKPDEYFSEENTSGCTIM